MRVTFNGEFNQAAADLAQAARQLGVAQREVSSGRRLHVPSDDPSAAAGAVRERSELAALDRYRGAAEGSASLLAVVDTVLGDMLDRLSAAKTAILGAQGSSVTDLQREAAASELAGIRDALASDFNAQFRGTFLFAGTKLTSSPYTRQPDGTISAYQGDTGTVLLDIDRQTSVAISLNGDTLARGNEADDLFVQIERAITAVRAGDDTALATASAALQGAFDRVSAAQSRTGTAMNVVAGQQARIAALTRAGEARIDEYEATNMAEAISRMNQAETAYRAALGAIGTRGQMSLMDYLR